MQTKDAELCGCAELAGSGEEGAWTRADGAVLVVGGAQYN